MSDKNIKVPYECMKLKEYKLSDSVLEFSEFRQSDDISKFGCENIEDNVIRLEKRGKVHFENMIAIIPSCKSHHTIKNEIYEKN